MTGVSLLAACLYLLTAWAFWVRWMYVLSESFSDHCTEPKRRLEQVKVTALALAWFVPVIGACAIATSRLFWRGEWPS